VVGGGRRRISRGGGGDGRGGVRRLVDMLDGDEWVVGWIMICSMEMNSLLNGQWMNG